mgnify:CR=1 FL=1
MKTGPVVVGGAPVKPRTLHTQFDHIPIIMQPMNGVPMQPYMSPFTNQQDTVGNRAGTADWGRPVYHMNRDIVPAFDRNLTYMAVIMPCRSTSTFQRAASKPCRSKTGTRRW